MGFNSVPALFAMVVVENREVLLGPLGIPSALQKAVPSSCSFWGRFFFSGWADSCLSLLSVCVPRSSLPSLAPQMTGLVRKESRRLWGFPIGASTQRTSSMN